MEHLFRIAFWICTLSGCLQAIPIPKNDFDFENVRRLCPKPPLTATFHSPTNVKGGCITTALECFKSQLGKVDGDCYDLLWGSLGDLISDEKNATGHGLTNSTECACQKSTRRSFDEFLKAMESLVMEVFSTRSSRQ